MRQVEEYPAARQTHSGEEHRARHTRRPIRSLHPPRKRLSLVVRWDDRLRERPRAWWSVGHLPGNPRATFRRIAPGVDAIAHFGPADREAVSSLRVGVPGFSPRLNGFDLAGVHPDPVLVARVNNHAGAVLPVVFSQGLPTLRA